MREMAAARVLVEGQVTPMADCQTSQESAEVARRGSGQGGRLGSGQGECLVSPEPLAEWLAAEQEECLGTGQAELLAMGSLDQLATNVFQVLGQRFQGNSCQSVQQGNQKFR
jgi:hypothetical protein